MSDYKGKFEHYGRQEKEGFIVKVKINTADIYLVTRIFEGFSHLGFATPLDAQKGIVGIYTTPENLNQVLEIVNNMPVGCELID